MEVKRRRSRLTTIQIIEDFKEVHGDKYDYSLVDYKTMHTKVKITCSTHGEFEQTPNAHIRQQQNCPKCGQIKMSESQRDTTESFILKAKEMYGNRYDYSLVEYGNTAHDKVRIICKEHGVFEMCPNNHLSQKSNCQICSQVSGKRKLLKGDTLGWGKQDWIRKCKGKVPKLYILKCWSEEEVFTKIGITSKPIKRRFAPRMSMPYQYEIVKLITGEAGYIYDLENILLRASKNLKYIPKIDFAGKTECRSILFDYKIYYKEVDMR